MKLLLLFIILPLCNCTAQEPKLMLPIGHTNIVYSAVFSADGKKIVTASQDKTAKVWDAETGELLADLEGHTLGVISAVFSPDGKKIATCGGEGATKVWNAVTGIHLADMKGFAVDGHYVSFSPDGKKIATTVNSIAQVCDAETGIL